MAVLRISALGEVRMLVLRDGGNSQGLVLRVGGGGESMLRMYAECVRSRQCSGRALEGEVLHDGLRVSGHVHVCVRVGRQACVTLHVWLHVYMHF